MLGLAPMLDDRFHVVSLRAPLTFGPSAYGWFPVQFLPEGFLIDEEVAERSRKQVVESIDLLVKQYGADPKRVYLLGFSQGAIISLAAGLTEPEKVAGIVAMSGRLLPQVEPMIAPPERLEGLPITAVHGVYDEVIPVRYGREIRDRLGKLPVDLTYREYPMGHHVTQDSMADIARWLSGKLNESPR